MKLSKRMTKKTLICALLIVAMMAVLAVGAFAADGEGEEFVPKMFNTFWSLVPPILAIALALITKEVYISLFFGILAGALFMNDFAVVPAVETVFGSLLAETGDSWNLGILVFLVILGIIVAMMNKAGGSAAYGVWAQNRIKTRRGALLSVFVIGVVLAIDDYFNCLTTGNVMRPVTDGHKVSRAKLAYMIDATAAPMCMIMPISSWAAAVSGLVVGYNGLSLFVKAIPYNYYSLLTITTLLILAIFNIDFGPMKKHEQNAANGDLYTTPERPYEGIDEVVTNPRAKVIDLFIPVIGLIIFCVIGLIYTGGFFSGETFLNAFAGCDAAAGLVYGSFLALIFIFIYYSCRRVLSLKAFAESIPAGFVAMVPAILILIFAWTLKHVTLGLGAQEYVAALVDTSKGGLANFLPAIVFIIAVFLAFSTGTSWGTFGILIPIVVAVFDGESPLMLMTISACLAGSVCGDHCSPISDTTIMASTGAHCFHMNHVSTQLPYALLVAGVSFVNYIISGLIQNIWICLPIAILSMIGVLFIIRAATNKKSDKVAAQ